MAHLVRATERLEISAGMVVIRRCGRKPSHPEQRFATLPSSLAHDVVGNGKAEARQAQAPTSPRKQSEEEEECWGWEALLIDRSRGLELPKGHVEIGEIPSESAVREVREEAGVSGVSCGPLVYTTNYRTRKGDKTVFFFLGMATQELRFGKRERRTKDLVWVSQEQLQAAITGDNVNHSSKPRGKRRKVVLPGPERFVLHTPGLPDILTAAFAAAIATTAREMGTDCVGADT